MTNNDRKILNEKLEKGFEHNAFGLESRELWELMTDEWQSHQGMADQDDMMSLSDFASEYAGTSFYGAKVVHDGQGGIFFVVPANLTTIKITY